MTATEPTAEPTLPVLLDRWDRLVWRFAHRIARRTGLDIEDARSELILAVVSQFYRFSRAKGAFSTWLGYVARGVLCHLIDHAKHRPETVNIRPHHQHEDYCDPIAGAADDRYPLPHEAADHRERLARVHAALAGLSEQDRDVLLRRFWHTGSVSRNEVAGALPRALGRLREVLTISGFPAVGNDVPDFEE